MKTCLAEKIMHPMRWTVQCGLPLNHKGDHERWSETKKWVTRWDDDAHGATSHEVVAGRKKKK